MEAAKPRWTCISGALLKHWGITLLLPVIFALSSTGSRPAELTLTEEIISVALTCIRLQLLAPHPASFLQK
jgi:hypothetical protein